MDGWTKLTRNYKACICRLRNFHAGRMFVQDRFCDSYKEYAKIERR
jgi:hypothetical protein